MAKFGKGWAFVGLSVATSMAIALGCGTRDDSADSSSSDITSSPDLVISQVYGGGGTQAGVLKNDYVELFNLGTAPVSLNGKALQYVGAASAFTVSRDTVALPDKTIDPGHYFLIKLSGGADGADLPVAADFEVQFGMAKDSGKLAIVDAANALDSCGAPAGADGGTPCVDAKWFDLVGYGDASASEGSPVDKLASDKAAFRVGGPDNKPGGCTDTGNNKADFVLGAPAPRNSQTPKISCDAVVVVPPADAGADADAATAADADAATTDAATHDADAAPAEGGHPDSGHPDGGHRPYPDAAASGDDDDDSPVEEETGGWGKPKPAPKAPLRSGSSDCSMAPGPANTGSGLGLAFGLALVAASFRTRRRTR